MSKEPEEVKAAPADGGAPTAAHKDKDIEAGGGFVPPQGLDVGGEEKKPTTGFWGGVQLYFQILIGTDPCDLDEEQMEEVRMETGFETREIRRLRRKFLESVDDSRVITQQEFRRLEAVRHNPLLDRLEREFGLHKRPAITFLEFMRVLAVFNSSRQREAKLHAAFNLQDFDGDGQIDKNDLLVYLERVASSSDSENQLDFETIANGILAEASSHASQQFLTYDDFQKVVVGTDFESKMFIPF